MATWEQLRAFHRKHNLEGPGIYIVSVDPVEQPLVKVGMSKNLMSRLGDYKRNLGGRLKILGVARISGSKAVGGNVRQVAHAEKQMLADFGKDKLFNQREWVRGEHREDALRAFVHAHSAFAYGKPEGTALYMADDIVANRITNRKFIDLNENGQVTRLPVKADHNYNRLRRVLEAPWPHK
jgi:hypothetical protein